MNSYRFCTRHGALSRLERHTHTPPKMSNTMEKMVKSGLTPGEQCCKECCSFYYCCARADYFLPFPLTPTAMIGIQSIRLMNQFADANQPFTCSDWPRYSQRQSTSLGKTPSPVLCKSWLNIHGLSGRDVPQRHHRV